MSGREDTETKSAWPRAKKLKVALIAATVVLGGTALWFRMTYPHGVSHCCATELGANLKRYAADHDGWLPKGAISPEASFSQLHTNYESNLQRLRGKIVPLATAEAAWNRYGWLEAESCGWHYIEGLATTNDPSIAIAWDKSWGLGHNGQRIRKFGREVIYLDGSTAAKLLKDWPQFAIDQREKLARVMASRSSGAPPIRWSDEETLGTNWSPAPKPK